jgi:hypothetical protein
VQAPNACDGFPTEANLLMVVYPGAVVTISGIDDPSDVFRSSSIGNAATVADGPRASLLAVADHLL